MSTMAPPIQEKDNECAGDTPPEIPVTRDPDATDNITTPVIISFEDYWNDCSNVKTPDKNRYILAACHGVVKDFSLKNHPYDKQTNRLLPTNAMLRQEALRRFKDGKGFRHKNMTS